MSVKAAHIVPPCSENIEILYQDDYLLVINKPQPMLSTPGRLPENRDSAISRIQQQFPSAELVHRLDMATSGLMLIPLSKPVLSDLSRQFQQRQIDKAYTALLFGVVENDKGHIDLPIMTDWENRPMQKVCYEHGKPSLTEYSVVERMPEQQYTRVIFNPITGRSHQLRIHSREIGHPILGCQLYHNTQSAQMAARLMLHAHAIEFRHPISGQRIHIDCPAPF